MTAQTNIPQGSEDPLVRSSRREAKIVAAIWAAALVYTVGYCVRNGYGRPVETLSFVFGIPDWVFWGILAPWAACTLAACWFSFFFMRDHDLESESDASESNENEDGRSRGGDQ